MDSALVIKVKYGDSLRRFNARVNENNLLDLDMVRLRAKILSLFNIPADANFIMRYVDEDGDMVTLVDDNDLYDVMKQCLKFLRIDVNMTNDSVGESDARSTRSDTLLRSSPLPNQFLCGNAAIADALKSVPTPLLETLYSLSLDFVSKAATSSPVVTTLADCISKMGTSVPNSDCQPQVESGPGSKNGQESITDKGRGPQSKYVQSISNASQQVEAGNVTRGIIAGVASVDLNVLPSEPIPCQSTSVNPAPLSSAVVDGDGKMGNASAGDSFTGEGGSSRTCTSCAASDNSSTLTTAMGSIPLVVCPSSETHITDSVASSFGNHHLHPFKRSNNHTEARVGIFHKGIQCDGCGVYPITGPRFKSKVKENYDLCSICLNEMGNGTDYIRMDHPESVRGQQSFKGPWMGSPTIPHFVRTGSILKHARPKLDSRFILDVNGIDGMVMAPSTTFTRIWRMRNTGASVWPKGTQLVWTGGHKLSDSQSVDLEVPEDGVLLDKELDIAVDFRAPQLPGQYISCWQMACPSGKKFGQHVCVCIQVDASLNNSFNDGSQGLSLNIPLNTSGCKGPRIIDINVQPSIDDALLQPHNPSPPTVPVKPKVDEQPWEEPENNFPIDDSTVDGHSALPPTTSMVPSSVSYPVIDFSETAPAVPSIQQSPTADPLPSSLGIGGNNSVQEALLKEPTFDGHNALSPPTSVAPSSVSYPIIDFSETAPAVPSNQQSSTVDALSSSLGIGGNNSVERALLEVPTNGHSASPPATSVAPLSDSYPIINFSETAPAVPSNLKSSTVDALSSSLGNVGNNSVEESLLKELEEMGFKQVDLNKRTLRMNEYNLEKTVYDLCDASETAPAVPSNQQSWTVDALSSSPGIGRNTSVEEAFLKELEEMGFKQDNVNKETLRMNEYSLEQTVDDLCDTSEWDSILEELQEMGLCNNEMIKRLLKKNNGSIKHVVMDLINGDKV